MNTPLVWFKSSHSNEEGGDCVEVASHHWFKSSHSNEEGGNCVEVAGCPHAVHVRDSKAPDGPRLALPAATWAGFLAHLTEKHTLR